MTGAPNRPPTRGEHAPGAPATRRQLVARREQRRRIYRRRRIAALGVLVLLLGGTVQGARALSNAWLGSRVELAAVVTGGDAGATAATTAGTTGGSTAGPGTDASASSAPVTSGGAPASAAGSTGPPTAVTATSAAAPARVSVGAHEPAGGGDYVLWQQGASWVALVDDGVVVRTMPTTGLAWKTPVGDYVVKYKMRQGRSFEDGDTWRLDYFVGYHRRAGATSDIGFHSIPVNADGGLIQSAATIGDAGFESHGCERLRPEDAKALYEFVSVGTAVRVRA